jgi:hypothetical protein
MTELHFEAHDNSSVGSAVTVYHDNELSVSIIFTGISNAVSVAVHI